MKHIFPLFQDLDYKNIRSCGKSPGSPQGSELVFLSCTEVEPLLMPCASISPYRSGPPSRLSSGEERRSFGEVCFPKGYSLHQRQAKLCALPLQSTDSSVGSCLAWRLTLPPPLLCCVKKVAVADALSSCIMNVFLFISPYPTSLAF